MFVTLVSGGQFSHRANQLYQYGDPGSPELPEGSFDSIDEAASAVIEAGISLDYAIYA